MVDVRALIIADGMVINAANASPEFATLQGWRFGAGTESVNVGWLANADGTFSPPAAPLPIVPDEVSAAQAKTALYNAGIYDDVEAVLGAAPDGLVRIWWQSAQVWRRDHPYILAVATFLDPPLDDDQVDALFVAAAAVPT